ncbi:MAG: hypothetical protein ABEH77_01015 [Halobacteriaceae archaeon]
MTEHDPAPFLWFGGGSIGPTHDPDEPAAESVLAYLARNGVAVAVTDLAATAGEAGGAAFEAKLAAAREAGVEVLVNAGMVPSEDQSASYTDRELAGDEAAMAAFLDPLRETARVYADYYPRGRLLVWHEAPIMGNWSGDSYAERADSVAEHGPAIFAAQKRAVREVAPDLDVGVFPHDIPVAPPSHSTAPVCERLFAGFDERGERPDFVFLDSYRSHHEWAAGCEPADEFVRATVENVREHADAPVFYLGEAHTDNNQYTPSRDALLGNLRAALAAGVEGYGWYSRGQYHRTSDRCYAPFVPDEGAVVDEQFTTLTGSRDRLLWANELVLNGARDGGERVDLWVYGHDLDFHEHRLDVRRDGEWTFLADISGYADGDNPYSGGGRHRVCAVHALDRSLLTDGLDVRLRSRGAATLEGVYALPHLTPGLYLTEPEATAVVEAGRVGEVALGAWEGSARLAAGGERAVSLDAADPSVGPVEFRYPEQAGAYERVAGDERPPRERFDLWVWGRDLDGLDVTVAGEPAARFAAPLPAERFAETEAVVYRSLPRERLAPHPGGE